MYLPGFIRFNMDTRNMVSEVLLDLQKAFDSVDHGTLFMKFNAICVNYDIWDL